MAKKHKKNKYAGYTKISRSLDLHDFNGPDKSVSQREIWEALDEFIEEAREDFAEGISKYNKVLLGVICGKGIHSKNFIHGKNYMRVFVEKYIKKHGLKWRNGKPSEGDFGVIVIEINSQPG